MSRNPNGNPGFVYVLQSDHGFKIGRTKNPKGRTQLFSVKLPFDFEVVYMIPVGDMLKAEKQLHERFDKKQINGEWFRLEAKDLVSIREILSSLRGPFEAHRPECPHFVQETVKSKTGTGTWRFWVRCKFCGANVNGRGKWVSRATIKDPLAIPEVDRGQGF